MPIEDYLYPKITVVCVKPAHKQHYKKTNYKKLKGLLLWIPKSLPEKGSLFLKFCATYIGPKSDFWGRVVDEKEIENLESLSRQYHRKNYRDEHFTQIRIEDVKDIVRGGLWVQYLGPYAQGQKKNIQIFQKNLNLIFQKRWRSIGSERNPNPPLEAYLYRDSSGRLVPYKNNWYHR